MPYIGKQLVRGQNRKLDDISSGFNGSQTTFTLQIASQNVSVGSALQLWISVGGVIQNPLTDFTIAGNQITFTTAPAASLDFFGVIQGDVTDTNTPGDATVTTSKLSTGLTVNLADGSAATSSLQLGGTDSGLFSSAADKVNVTTGGVERLEIGSSEVVFNDGSNDVDFRVESNGNAHMLFVDGGNDRVGIGASSPSVPFTVQSDSSTNAIAVLGRSADDISSTLFYENDGTTQIGRIQARQSYLHISGTDNTKGIYIDSSGNVGINNSSPGSYNSDGRNLVVGSGSGGQGLSIASGTSNYGTIYFADGTSGDALYRGAILYNHASDFMRFDTAAGERMRIDSSGKVGIGVSNPGDYHASANSLVTSGGITLANTTQGSIFFADSASGTGEYVGQISYDHANNFMLFVTNNTERMRIDDNGLVSTFAQGNNTNFKIRNAGNSSSSIYFIECFQGASSTTSGGNQKFTVRTNGGIQNFQSNDSDLSDEREKKNIVSLDAKWDKVKSWDIKKFHYNDDADTDDKRYGVIAQEVAEHCPEVVTDWLRQEAEDAVLDDEGNIVTPAQEEIVRKGIKTQQMMWMAIKALQEAQARIETLETEVAALKAG